MANVHMIRCSTPLAIREIEVDINITMKYHFTLTRMAIIKKIITSVSEVMEKLEPSHAASEDIKWCNHFGEKSGISAKD